MTRLVTIGRGALLGGTLGLPVLGLLSRAAMSVPTLVAGERPVWTLSGSLAVVVTGGLYGTACGAVLAALPRFLGGRPARRALVIGVLLLAGVAAVSTLRGTAGPGLARPLVSVGLFLPVTILWAALFVRIEGR